MHDKNEWEIGRLVKDVEKLQDENARQNEELREFDTFRAQTIERFKTAFNRLKRIETSNKWVSNTFFTLILTGVIGAVGTFLNWLLQR